jgi:hypothetical protein
VLLTVIALVLVVLVAHALRDSSASAAPTAPSRETPDWTTLPPEPWSVTSQRNKMRELLAALGDNEPALIAAYADAERRGEVQRRSNDYGLSPEEYARRLLADGRKKGWLGA